MVLPASHRIPRVLRYSGVSSLSSPFAYGTVTLSGRPFQGSSARIPQCATLILNPGEHAPRFGLFPVRSPLLRKSLFYFLFLRVLRCFSSPRALCNTMYSYYSDEALPSPGSPIRISAYHCLLAATRGFSQLATSFFGVWCQGIHPVLFVA